MAANNTPILYASDLSKGAELTVAFAKSQALALATLFLVSFALNQYFEFLAQLLANTDQGPWMAQLGELGVTFLEGFALLTLGTYYFANLQSPLTWSEYFSRYTSPLVAESLRAMAAILLWSLALLVPGFVVYSRLSLLPFVIILDPNYKTRPDAVAISMEMTKDCWFRISLLSLALAVIGLAFEIAPNLLKIEDLISRAIFDLANFLFSLFAFILLYLVFENLRSRKEAQKGN